MISIKSFFLRTALFQVLVVVIVWGVLLAWINYYQLPLIDKSYNEQQEIISKGLANLLENSIDDTESTKKISHEFENMYISATNNVGIVNYQPLLVVLDNKNRVIYSSPSVVGKLNFATANVPDTLVFDNEKWKISSNWGNQNLVKVVLGESYNNRRDMIGNPVESTGIALLVVLAIIILAIFITAYLSLHPLRQTARLISSRKPGNLTPIEVAEQYQEIRPIVIEINRLMGRVAAANQREKSFMADAAHELRTPIATVLAQLHLLTQVTDSQERQEIAGDMQQGLDQAASLSRQLIDLVKLEGDDFALNISQVDIHPLISHSIARHVPYALEQQIELSLEGCENIYIETDPQALLTIFNNLLDNAIKYIPPGSRVEVELRSLAPLGCHIILRDNGQGIDHQHQKNLFQRFYRVPGTQAAGSGLGLAIAQNTAAKIGASLRITEGLEGRGIGFIIDLPEHSGPLVVD